MAALTSSTPDAKPKTPASEGIRLGVLCMLVSLCGLGIIFYQANKALLYGVKTHLKDVANLAAIRIDGDAHKDLVHRDAIVTPAYEKACEPLLQLRKEIPNIYYVYTLTFEKDRPIFVLDTTYFIENQGDDSSFAYPREVYDDAPAEVYEAWKTTSTLTSKRTYTDKWGTFLSAFAPFRDSKGEVVGMVGIDISLKELNQRKRPLNIAFIIATISCLFGSFLIGTWRGRSHARLLNRESELHLARIAAEKSAIAARAGDQAKSDFLAIMSHEIRTPLNGVLGMAQSLLSTPLDDDQKNQVRTIDESGKLLLVILNDILDLSKIESKTLSLDCESTNILDLIHDSIDLHRKNAEQKQLSLTMEAAADAPTHVLGDTTRIRQILGNLISNAIKFTKQGSVTVRIDATDSRMARISIEDTGIGISQDSLCKLFIPFSQVDTSLHRATGGTGLGLAISYRLAILMKGNLTVESQEGKGSKFTLLLPIADSPDAPSKVEDAGPKYEIDPQLKVLVAEDTDINRRVVQVMLKQTGISAVFAEDGNDAVSKWREFQPDVILMDVQMPNLDGREATRLIRAECNHPTHPWIIALTGGVTEEDQQEAIKSGMNDFIAKPINKNAMMKALSQRGGNVRG